MAQRSGSRIIQPHEYVMKGDPQYSHPGYIKSKFVQQDLNDQEIDFVQMQLEKQRNEPYVFFNDFQSETSKVEGMMLGGSSIDRDAIKQSLKNNAYQIDDSPQANARVFAETSSTLYLDESVDGHSQNPPEAYLVEPVSRSGTSRTGFGLGPCGGGSKGKSRFYADPGEKTEVQWIIKNPAPNGHCQIRVARGHGDDESAFENVSVEGHGYDRSTGKFRCGDPDKAIEVVTVKLPYDTSCPDCTLQWIYDAPGFGKMYQCADISIVDADHREDCEGKCQNGGICENKK
jgi:hypothetical protein